MAKTLAANLGDSQIALMDAAFLISGTDKIVIDQVTTIKREFMAKSIDLPRYTKLAKATTPLTDGTAPTPVALADTKVTITPAEQGNVTTTTNLANLQTGGKADLAAAQLHGQNMAETANALGLIVGEAGSNILLANAAASEAAIVAGDTVQASDLNYVYNRLSRANVPMFPGETYIAVAHPDVLEDVKLLTGFVEIQKYKDAGVLLQNEIGVFKGFRWLSSAGVTINTDAGAAAVDTYHTQFYGINGIGKAVSQEPRLVISGPFDALQRELNIGWYGVFKYSIVDSDAHWIITSSSSLGANV